MSEILKDNKLLFSDNAKFITRNHQVVATNTRDGDWMRFSEECYQYILQAMNEEMSKRDLIECFEENEDKLYIQKLICNLEKINVIVDQKTKENENISYLESIDIMTTNRCNLACKHCATNAGNLKMEDCLTTEQLKSIIDKVMICEPKTIVLTGGEPLIRKDFLEIIHYIKSKGLVKLSIMTNATLITPKIAEEIARYVDTIDISMDGFDDESCSFIRGKGVFDLVIKNIKLLHENGMDRISLSMVSLDNNQIEEKKFNDLCKKINVTPVIRRLSFKGRALENKEYLSEKRNKKMLVHNDIPSVEELRNVMKACSCRAGITMLSVDEKGYIYPCITFSDEMSPLGNILKIENIHAFLDSIREKKYDKMKKIEQYIPYEEKLCESCDVRYFCWTCPYAAVDIVKNRNEYSNYCKGRKAFLFDLIWGEDINE